MRRGHLPALLAAIAALACAVLLAACGDDDDESSTDSGSTDAKVIERNPDNAGKQLTVGSKNFTEQFILGEIYAQALQAAGYKVKKDLNLGSEQIALKALKGGDVDGYPEYTSTALTSFFDVQPQDIPKDAQQAVEESQAKFAQEGLIAFDPTPFTSANAVGMLKKKADELGVKTVSDLEGKSEDLTLYGSPECRQRLDCLVGLAAGLRPQVQEVHAGRHRAALRRARQGSGRPVDHLHDRRPALHPRRRRDARGRQEGLPARERHVRGEQEGSGCGRARPADRRSRPCSRA